ncbi:M48 family metallopeptidase [bacterium]|nr:MAG: M48 family metallopeptidase [bacterium]
MNADTVDKKKYNRIKLTLSLFSTALGIAFIIAIVMTGFSSAISRYVESLSGNMYTRFVWFVVIIGFIESALTFPISYYTGYRMEHQYGMSNQTFYQWIKENLKGVGVGAVIGLPLLLVFYYSLNVFQGNWWLPVAIVFFLFSVLLARIAPTVIFPLFYKFKPIENESLKNKLIRLCSGVNMNISGIFEFNMSKTTKKANAAFAGIGKSKRIILADTLLENFSDEEIEVVFAHEVGHYYHKHITKSMLLSMVSIFLGLFVTSWLYELLLPVFGLTSITDLAALPLLGLLLMLFGFITGPINNALSRVYERQADAYALNKTKNKTAFISAMQRLSLMNLADDEPHPVVEFLFYSHPAISKRVRAAEAFVL